MLSKRLFFGILSSVALTLAVIGCGKSDSSTSSGSGAGASAQPTGLDADAQGAALAELAKHFVKTADGWTTARVSGSAYAPEKFLRQLHDIVVDEVQPAQISDSDKMNGVEWSGQITFKSLSVREAGDSGMVVDGLSSNGTATRQKGQWSRWMDYLPDPIQLQKIKGSWVIEQDTWLLRGTAPTPMDYANAGVK
jgi:hypothetical protein